jgi:hypothetical protein
VIEAVTCTNPDCPEVNVVKTNPGLDLETTDDITCGSCRGPVVEAAGA